MFEPVASDRLWVGFGGRAVSVVAVVLIAVVVVGAATGTAAAQSAPDCSTVTYNGDGSSVNPFEVSNVDQLQCIEDQGLNFNYEVVSDIDASETGVWNGGDGFEPIGENPFSGTQFNGTFDGAGHDIEGLNIGRGSDFGIGLFDTVGPPGTVTNVSLENVAVVGETKVGGIAGENKGVVNGVSASGSVGGDFEMGGLIGDNEGTVRDSSASSNLGGEGKVGGLIGQNFGSVHNSSASGNVGGDRRVGGLVGDHARGTVRNSSASATIEANGFGAGGLVGQNGGKVERSSATGNVSGDDDVGGLIGQNGGKVERSSASVNVEGNEEVGGLIGSNEDIVRNSSASGDIGGDKEIGGLVGLNRGTVEMSSSTGNATGNESVGGLVGFNLRRFSGDDATIEDSYARGDVSGSVEFVGGLVGRNGESGDPGTVRRSYATGEVTGPLPPIPIPGPFSDSDPISTQDTSTAGGLVGNNTAGTVTNSYWDVNTTGFTVSDGGTGLTTAEMNGSDATSNMQGFDFTTTWETVTNPDDYPILAWQSQPGPTPPNFEVSIDSTNSPVTEGETLSVTATVENTGGQQDTQTITATAGSLGSITRTVTLNGGESKTETVPVPTSQGDAGMYTVTVESDNDTATTQVTVEEDNGGDLFPDPLPGFNSPPQNTGQLDPNLYEDVSGDGDGLEPSQAVTLWTELVLNPDAFNDLTQEQIDALDWNGDGQLTPADAVSLWTEQVLAD